MEVTPCPTSRYRRFSENIAVKYSSRFSLAPLELGSAEDQSGKQPFVHLLDRIVELRLQNLRIAQAVLERLYRLRINLSAEEKVERALQRNFRIFRGIVTIHGT